MQKFLQRSGLHTPADFDRGPVFIETVLKSLHRANPQRLPVTLELGPIDDAVGLIADVPRELKAVFMTQLADTCPGIRVDTVSKNQPRIAGSIVWSRQLRLTPMQAHSPPAGNSKTCWNASGPIRCRRSFRPSVLPAAAACSHASV